MAVVHRLQPSFNNGEVSPLLYDRVDYQKFVSSVKSGKNMFVHPQGGMSNRAGTVMLAQAKQANVRLIPFEFSSTETYIIEFGNEYCRFYTANGQVVVDAVVDEGTVQVPYEIVSPFQTADLFKIRYCQCGDVMYIAWGGQPKCLVREGHTNWHFEDYDYKNGPFEIKDFDSNLSYTVSNSIATITCSAVDYSFTSDDVGKLFKMEATIQSQSYGGLVDTATAQQTFKNKVFFVAKSFNLKTSGSWNGGFTVESSQDGISDWRVIASYESSNQSSNYDFTKTLDEEDSHFIRLNFDGVTTLASTGLNFTFHCDQDKFPIYFVVDSITNLTQAIVTIQNDISYKIIDYMGTGTVLVGFTMPVLTSNTSDPFISFDGTARDLTNAYKIFDNDSSLSTRFSIEHGEASELNIYFAEAIYFTKVELFLKGDLYSTGVMQDVAYRPLKVDLLALISGSWKSLGRLIDDTAANDWYGKTLGGWEQVNGLKIQIRATSRSGPGGIYGIRFENLKKRQSTGTEDVYSTFPGYWSLEGRNPTENEIYQDRVIWITNNRIDATKISDYTNFGVSTDVTEDDAISVIVKDKKVDKINSVIAGQKLAVYSDDGNFVHHNDTFTPNSATFLKQGATGGSDVKPIVVRDHIIYAHPMKQAISDYAYSFETDGYAGQDITILANHLFDGKVIKTLAYQQEPYSIIWVLQEEGTVLACTYLRQQNVIAWTPMDFGGEVKSIAVCSTGTEEHLYLAVKRGDNTFVEKMTTRLLSTDPKECFFVDCGRTYRGDPATTISGLDYLEGQEVIALADGNVVGPFTVTSGSITLPIAASVVHVGLPFESVFETLTFDANMGDGSTLNRKKRVVALSVRYNQSRGSKVSVNGHREVDMLRRDQEGYNVPISLKSGLYREILPSAHNEATCVKIRQTDPLPITVVSVIPEIEYEK